MEKWIQFLVLFPFLFSLHLHFFCLQHWDRFVSFQITIFLLHFANLYWTLTHKWADVLVSAYKWEWNGYHMFQYITSTVRCNSLSPGSTLHCHNVANVVAAFSRSLVSFFSFGHNLLHRLMFVKYIVQGINGLRVCNSISPMCSCIEFSFRSRFSVCHFQFYLVFGRRNCKNAYTF